MSDQRLAFIGAGNMASAMIGGLIQEGMAPEMISAADPDAGQLEHVRELGVRATSSNSDAARAADAVILAVKPAHVEEAIDSLRTMLAAPAPLFISIAAGVTTASLQKWLGPGVPVIRCMPNTPAKLRLAASALYAGEAVSATHKALAERIVSAVGIVTWLESDSQMNAVTALSGSGPAYFFYVMQALEEAGTELGLDASTSRALVAQTALGAASMAKDPAVDTKTLREQVTSKGGTTEAALRVLADHQLLDLVKRAVAAANERSIELSKT